MKDKLITAGLLRLIGLMIDGKLLDHIKALVLVYINADELTGTEKKKAVTEELLALKDDLGAIVSQMAGWLLSTAIDIVHAYIVTRAERS